jgi:hypothetical protein
MATRLEIFAQILVIIDFTIEDDPNVSLFVAERLVTALDIDDAEASHRQSDVFLDKEPVVVRTAVYNLPVHRHQRFTIHSLRPLGMENATDSAHN